jgi:hypothetical protein
MDQRSKTVLDARDRLHEAVAELDLPIWLRPVEEFLPIEDSVLYARTEARELFVVIRQDVSWGPDLSHYIDEANEDRLVQRLTIEVPNALDGQIGAVVDMVKAWFV